MPAATALPITPETLGAIACISRWLLGSSFMPSIWTTRALSGTALLFRQNQLIEAQSLLLTEQNARIAEQTTANVRALLRLDSSGAGATTA